MNSKPWGGILETARARKCDAIVMASHGRSGLDQLFLGSETQRVLAHSRIPVFVIRQEIHMACCEVGHLVGSLSSTPIDRGAALRSRQSNGHEAPVAIP